jgi:hypothetical protein
MIRVVRVPVMYVVLIPETSKRRTAMLCMPMASAAREITTAVLRGEVGLSCAQCQRPARRLRRPISRLRATVTDAGHTVSV